MATLREVAAALERFSAAGKQVVAWGASYDQRQYYLAAHADEVYLHPMGAVMLEGFGRYRNYYRDALDKLGVTRHLIRVGKYKSAAEPYIVNGAVAGGAARPTRICTTASGRRYTGDVEKARKLPAGSIAAAIDDAAAAHGRGRRRPGQARAGAQAGRRPEDARRGARSC